MRENKIMTTLLISNMMLFILLNIVVGNIMGVLGVPTVAISTQYIAFVITRLLFVNWALFIFNLVVQKITKLNENPFPELSGSIFMGNAIALVAFAIIAI